MFEQINTMILIFVGIITFLVQTTNTPDVFVVCFRGVV